MSRTARLASSLPGRAVVAAAAGAALGLAFPPHGLVVLLPVAVALLSALTWRQPARRGFVLGAVFGSLFMLVLLPWLQVIGVDAWIGLSVLQGLFYGLLGSGLAVTSRLPLWPVWAAALWAAAELLRGAVPWGGFPWGRLAFAAVGTPAQGWVGWVGAAGTTFVLALAGATLAWAVTRVLAARRRRAVALTMFLPVLPVLLVLLVAGLPALLPAPGGTKQTGSRWVAAVQGDVPGAGMDAFAERRVVLDNHVAATRDLAARVDLGQTRRPDLVLWPENSTDIDPFSDASARAEIQGAVDAVDAPVLVGAMVGGPGPRQVRNEGIVWLPGTGPATAYAKRHPVPFGEYIPLRDQLAGWFERLDMIPRDMVPGTRSGVLDVGGTTLGDLICFEVAYDDLVRDLGGSDAGLLVVQTNNATYMGTGQVEQQFAIARLRAAETGRWMVVVATNGVSGIIDPAGRVVQRAPVREQVVLTHDVPLVGGLTPGVRLGGWVDRGLVAVAALAVVAAVAGGILGGRRLRTPTPSPSVSAAPLDHPAAAPPERAAAARPAEPSGTGR